MYKYGRVHDAYNIFINKLQIVINTHAPIKAERTQTYKLESWKPRLSPTRQKKQTNKQTKVNFNEKH